MADVAEKVLWLRQRYQFGPVKFAMYRHRYHQVTICRTGVSLILHRAGVNRLRTSQRSQRREIRWSGATRSVQGTHSRST